MTTETDLRNALTDSVDVAVDVEAFRARLQMALADQDCANETAQFEVQRPSVRDASKHAWHRWSAIAIAACLAAIAAAIWVASRHTSSTPPTHHSTPGPHVLGVRLYPGSTVLGVLHGTGSRTVQFPAGHATPGPHEQYMVYLACSSGRFAVRDGQSGGFFGRCADAIGGGSVVRTHDSVHVQVQPNTTWRLGIAIEPDARTNAGVESGDTAVVHRGRVHRGNGVVTFRHTEGLYALHMTCSGTGFRLSGMKGAVKGDYTHTCFAGFSYVWDLHDVILPVTLHVQAAPGTTWTATVR